MYELCLYLCDSDEFLQCIGCVIFQSYCILVVWDQGKVVVFVGYCFQENLVYGFFFYVDDLVVVSSECGKCWGEWLLVVMEEVVVQVGCVCLVFDIGMVNVLVQCFYFCQGMLIGVLCFGKVIGGGV